MQIWHVCMMTPYFYTRMYDDVILKYTHVYDDEQNWSRIQRICLASLGLPCRASTL